MKCSYATFLMLLLSTTVYASPYAVSPTPDTESCISNPSICPDGTYCSGREDGIQNDGCCPEGYELDWKSGMCSMSCIDHDSDGYGAEISFVCEFASYIDCDDTSALIHPFAYEVDGNGKDDDCDGEVDEGHVPVYEDLSPRGKLDQTPTTVPGCNPKSTIDFCGDNIDNNCDSLVDETCSRVDMNLSGNAESFLRYVNGKFLNVDREKIEEFSEDSLTEVLKGSKIKNAAKRANIVVTTLSYLHDLIMKYAEGTFTWFWFCKDIIDKHTPIGLVDELYNQVFPQKVATAGDVMCQNLKTPRDGYAAEEMVLKDIDNRKTLNQKKSQSITNLYNGITKGQGTSVPYDIRFRDRKGSRYPQSPIQNRMDAREENIYINKQR